MRSVIAGFKLFAFAIIALLVIPTQSTVLLFTKGPGAYHLPRLWHSGVCWIFRIKYETRGHPATDHQTLYMSNHVSYLDIPVIGSILKASFVAKSEVAGWPVFGFLSTLQQTAFMERKRTAIVREAQTLKGRIDAGKSLIIFPEGTSTDGQEVLPFKTSLFSLALPEDRTHLMVQPMTLKLIEVDGRKPATQEDRDIYSWHIKMDTDLPEHLWRFAKSKGAKVRIIFHEPLRAADFEDRKILAKACHDNVSKGLQTELAA